MCLVCKDFLLGNLTVREALNNLAEMTSEKDVDHAEEALRLIARGAPDPFEGD